VDVVEGDLSDPASLRSLLASCDALVYVASLGFGHADAVVSAVEDAGIERAVYFSSTSLFTRLPAASKTERVRAEERVRRSPGSWTLLRPTMIYGDEGDRNLSRLIRFVARSPLIPLPGGGRGLIQPVHVEDLAAGAVGALESPAATRREYELSGAVASPLREVVDFLRGRLRSRALIVSLPIRPMAAAAALWARCGLPPRVTREQVLRLAEDKAFSYSAAKGDFGYSPRGWRDGLSEEVDRLRQIGWVR